MAVSESLTVTVNAPLAEVLRLLRDIDNQHTWFPGNLESEVIARSAEGLATRARMVNDVKVARDEFILDYTHSDTGFSWHLPAPTAVQKVHQGSWELVARDGQTQATMSLRVDSSLPLPGFVQRKVVKDTLQAVTRALAEQF